MTRGLASVKGGRLIQVKITKKDNHRTSIGWPLSFLIASHITHSSLPTGKKKTEQ